MNNLLDPADTCNEQSENHSCGDVPPPATPNRRASVDIRPVSPLAERKVEPALEMKPSQTKSHNEVPAPPPPPPPPPLPNQNLRRGSVDVRPISPVPDRKSESGTEPQVLKEESRKKLFVPDKVLLFCDNFFFFIRHCRLVDSLKTRCFPGN